MERRALPLTAAEGARPGPLPPPIAALRIVHPFPTLLNVAATIGLAFIASDGRPDDWLLARMALMMLFAQSAIGVANDLFDRELDAATKPSKPLISGAVSSRAAQVLVAACLAAAIGLAATLGIAGFALAMLGIACGLAYDAKLKRTALSAVPFMAAIPTLPFWVWATLDVWDPVLWWLAPLGALIGLSLHLANTLPDIENDARHGVRGLAHRLGERRSMLLAWASFVAALVLAVGITPLVEYDLRVFVPTVALAAALLFASIAMWAGRRSAAALQFGFVALGIAAPLAAGGWLASVT